MGNSKTAFLLSQVVVLCAAQICVAAPAGRPPATNHVSITVTGGERLIEANGFPNHVPGQFPRQGNPNTIAAQNYHFHLPLSPQVADKPTAVRHLLFGVALNGVPFDPGTAEFYNNDPASGWNYEAKSPFINLGLDDHNAHVQPNGAYHYHASPRGLVSSLGPNQQQMLLIGYAADGFPIYTGYGHVDVNRTNSPLKKMRSSYRLKSGARPAQPGGNYDGKFTEDYTYVPGAGDLDECNGRFGPTPQFPQGTYHYYLTDDFPYIPRMLRGKPDPSFQKTGPRPGRLRPPPARLQPAADAAPQPLSNPKIQTQ